MQNGRGEHRKALGAVLGHALGRNFAEDQHDDGHHDGRDRRARVAIVPDEEHRADGGHEDVYNVVADQDRGEQFVVMLQKLAGKLCFFAALLREGFEPRAVGRGKRRLGGRKIGGQDKTRRHDDQTGCGRQCMVLLFCQWFVIACSDAASRYRRKKARPP